VAQKGHSVASSYGVNRCIPGAVPARDEGDERKTIVGGRRHSSHPKQLDAGPFEAEVGSFWLHLAAEGKAGRTLDTYTKAVRWFAAAHLVQHTDKTRWEQVDRQDLQRWTVRLLGEYRAAYASNQFRAVRLFLRWLAVEEDRPDPVAGLRAPKLAPGSGAGVQQRRTFGSVAVVPGQEFRGAQGCRDYRGAAGNADHYQYQAQLDVGCPRNDGRPRPSRFRCRSTSDQVVETRQTVLRPPSALAFPLPR
jgi:hypothetical protein